MRLAVRVYCSTATVSRPSRSTKDADCASARSARVSAAITDRIATRAMRAAPAGRLKVSGMVESGLGEVHVGPGIYRIARAYAVPRYGSLAPVGPWRAGIAPRLQ